MIAASMPLTLKSVEPARGLRWVRQGFSLFARRPLAFASMFVLFLLAALVVSLLPLAGGLIQMAALPLLSLGFMVAGQSALLGGAVKPTQFFDPLRGDAKKRRALLTLCLIYGVCALAILLLCDALSDSAMQRVQSLMAKNVPQTEIDAILAEPGVAYALLVGVVLGSLLSVPFWHAPALVHWGSQSVGQALFSSTVAMWRSKGAFALYGAAWTGLIVVFGVATALIFGLLGARQLASVVAMPAGLLFSTVFYVSLLFTFNDSFGGGAAAVEQPAA
jgi:hypothetical protein